MKKGLLIMLMAAVLIGSAACSAGASSRKSGDGSGISDSNTDSDNHSKSDSEKATEAGEDDGTELKETQIINEAGDTLSERIRVPEGYSRTEEKADSLAEFIRSYKLKPAGSPVLLYDGSSKGNQSDHVAVFELPIEDYDLQQCADSVMRFYAEYFWNTKQYDKIAFHFTNGFLAEYSKWREGYRISVSGNDVAWTKKASYDDSYECFVTYMKSVFTYAGTLSMETEAAQIELDDIRVGDVFLYGASPGHVVMIVDVCENEAGKKAFLLGQGYMPAQEFHLLKNNLHDDDPWYYEDEVTYPFRTPEYTFKEGSLKRLSYLD